MRPEKTVIQLPYGASFLEVAVPANNLACVLERQKTPVPEDELEAVRQALSFPINSLLLRERLDSHDKVVVLVTDNTRACPDEKLLPVILKEIEEKVPRQNISIIVALGLHPPLSKDALIQKLGKEILDNYQVNNHNFEQTIQIGTTTRGTPVEINKEVVEADFIISTGFIEPHFFAGFSGGRKSIAPGVSSPSAIRKNHSYEMISHKNARAGILEGNPVHEDLVEQAKLAGLTFIVNVLLDSKGQIIHVVAGDPVLAHEKGCELEKAIASAYLDHEVDITIITNGGAPLDLDLYQACKGIDTAARITRKGGTIIVASLCNSGVGPQAFCDLHSSSNTPEQVLKRIRDEEVTGVCWQNQILARAQQHHTVFLLSALPDRIVRDMQIRPISSIENGIEQALSILGKDAEIAVIPEGPRVLPFITKPLAV